MHWRAFLVAVVPVLALRLGVPLSVRAQLVEVPTFVAAAPSAGAAIAYPDVAVGADDSMLFAWVDQVGDIDQWRGFIRHFAANGAVLGAPFRLDLNGGVTDTHVAGSSQGGFVAIWERRTTADQAVEARFFDTGLAPLTPLLTVDPGGNYYRSNGVATGSSGSVVAWRSGAGVSARRYDSSNQPLGAEMVVRSKALHGDPHVRVAVLGDGGFVVGWFELDGSWGRRYDASGNPVADATRLATEFRSSDVAASPQGGFAIVGSRDAGTHALPAGVWAQRFAASGAPLGPAFVVALAEDENIVTSASAAFDPQGRLYVAWTFSGPGAQHPRGRLYAADGEALGPAFDVSAEVIFSDLAMAIRPDGRLVHGWRESGELHGNVLAPCVAPFHATCGDGAVTAPCERCDAGVANSDTTPDACRTSCHLPACGDGTVDTGEECDDGNRRGCDGCDAECVAETGWVCGDGVVLADCDEQCDAGAANSDTAPDACRTDCRQPGCGDGAVDSDETCDDGNRTPCDGCGEFCVAETGLVCGDGIPELACGEQCDDGNSTEGDGCLESCRLERIPGGGSPHTDCRSAWSIDNPANQPRYDKRGFISAAQQCLDGDPRCDFDGVVNASCTFHLRVCAANSDMPATCYPELRLASWVLTSPSAAKAAKEPALAAVRAAFAAVPGVLVGPTTLDHCTDTLAVVVPLRTSAGGSKAGKLGLKARAEIYSGEKDGDTLRLVCRPGGV